MGSPAFEQARPDTADPARRLGPAAANRDVIPGGNRLSAADQAFFGAAFGADFSRVRVHTDDQAAVSADAAHADAFTVGHHVFFAEDRYAPATQAGRVLLGHELAHVVQQQRGSGSGAADDASAQLDAHQAGRAAAAGGPVAVTAARPVGLARQAAESPPEPAGAPTDAGTRIEAAIVRRVLGALGIESTTGPVAVEFVRGMFQQLATEHIGSTLWANLSIMSSGDAGQLAKGFGIGLGEGLFSPLTDLFGLAVFGERVSALEQTLLVSVLAYKGDLSAAATWLAKETTALRQDLHIALAKLKSQSAAETVTEILELPDALTGVAVQKAHELGVEAAKQIASALDPSRHPVQEQEASPSFTKTPLAWLQAKAGALESKIISTPWAEFGKRIGYGIGMVAIQIVLLVFTEGLGNAIEQVGAALGRVAGLLSRLGAGIGAAAARVAEFIGAVGKGVAVVEEGIGLILGKLLKPFEPLLQPVVRLLEDLRGFLRNLLGVPEKEIVTALEGTASKAADSLSHDVPPAAPLHAGPEPHAPLVHATPESSKPTPSAPKKPVPASHESTAEPVAVPTAPAPAEQVPSTSPAATAQAGSSGIEEFEGLDKAFEEYTGRRTRRPGTPLRKPASNAASTAARDRFNTLQPSYAQRLGVNTGGQVHHAIELQVLDRYPGAFTEAEINGFPNMRGIPGEDSGLRQLHNSKIREIWNTAYRRIDQEIATRKLIPGSTDYNKLVRSYMEDTRDTIDHVLGQFFSEYRTGRPRSFQ
jgi:hypothetical protein